MTAETYDYVIVGAGSAGCVLAGRLSDAGASILLLEAGGADANPLISIPVGMGKMHQHHMHEWGDLSEPEPNLEGRRMRVTHGKVIGGSSSINIMAYTRGHPRDYDRWARNGARGWSYVETLPYFKRGKSWEGGHDGWRGGDGPTGTQWARTRDPIYLSWVEAGRQAGFRFTADYNGAEPEGFGLGQYTIRDGRRSSAARAFLRPARGRKNLTVVTHAMAARALFERGRAVGVAYVRDGHALTARAEREVILSAGAINSPQFLMLSGIGPASHLNEMGVRPIADLPVGQNLQDHLGVALNWRRRTPGPFHAAMRFDRMAVSMVRAYLFGEGPATVVPGGLHAFIKTAADVETPDIEFMFHTVPPETDLWFPGLKKAYADGFGIRPTIMRPGSRGEIRLRSLDPGDRPLIVYNALSVAENLSTLREGFKCAQRVAHSPAMDAYRGALLTPDHEVRTDSEIDAYIRATAITMLHPVGTCRMGDDDDAVTDPELKVRGVEGLRVVDASVMPDLVSAHINAAVLMIAEKAADMILGRPALVIRDESILEDGDAHVR